MLSGHWYCKAKRFGFQSPLSADLRLFLMSFGMLHELQGARAVQLRATASLQLR